ncbi:UNVERIFIED_CONTAM: hypothetical protein HDU68_000361 [Siphonaria sp. JEL0065]|nr:hypothetical protein HDU68_000361 [Siphonaria sp. JEL0065]
MAPRGSLDPNTAFLQPSKRANSNSQLRWQHPITDNTGGVSPAHSARQSFLVDSDEETTPPTPKPPLQFDDRRASETSRSPPVYTVSRQPSDAVLKHNFSHLEGHRAVNIDDATVSIEFPDHITDLEKSDAISHHVIQNTSLSPLPPIKPGVTKSQRLKGKSGGSKASLYIRVVKPVIYSFLGKPIPSDSQQLAWWCFLIDIFHLSLLILIPVQLAWTDHFTEIGWVIFYGFMDAIMLFDCWIQARIDYKDEYGLLVQDIELVAKRYLFVNHGLLECTMSWPWEFVEFAINDAEAWGKFLGPTQIGDPVT